MLRKFVLFGIVAGASASVPILHQGNPESLWGLLAGRSVVESGSVAEPETTVVAPDTTAAAPGATADARPRDEGRAQGISGRKVRLAADESGHFVSDFRLNGRTVQAMVDTGASAVAINRSTARRIGISLAASDFTVPVNTANGSTMGALATIERLEVGRVTVHDVQAVVLDDAALSGTLIGMSFLSRLKRYHVENRAMVLEQ